MATTIIWPSTLPQLFLASGFGETPPNTALVSTMDDGPKKMRRKSTCGVRTFTGKMLFTRAQQTIFDDFYWKTTKSGTLSFNFRHPRTGYTVEAWFAAGSQPSYSNPTGLEIYCSFTVETLS